MATGAGSPASARRSSRSRGRELPSHPGKLGPFRKTRRVRSTIPGTARPTEATGHPSAARRISRTRTSSTDSTLRSPGVGASRRPSSSGPRGGEPEGPAGEGVPPQIDPHTAGVSSSVGPHAQGGGEHPLEPAPDLQGLLGNKPQGAAVHPLPPGNQGRPRRSGGVHWNRTSSR